MFCKFVLPGNNGIGNESPLGKKIAWKDVLVFITKVGNIADTGLSYLS